MWQGPVFNPCLPFTPTGSYGWIKEKCSLHSEEVKVQYNSILTLVLDRHGWSASSPGSFTPGKSPRHPLNRRLGGSHSPPWRFGEHTTPSRLLENAGIWDNYEVKTFKITKETKVYSVSWIQLNINPLKTKRNLLYIRNQSVPRSKHFPPRL